MGEYWLPTGFGRVPFGVSLKAHDIDMSWIKAWPSALPDGNSPDEEVSQWFEEGYYRVSDFYNSITQETVADVFHGIVQLPRLAPQRDQDAFDIASFCGHSGFDFSSGMSQTVRTACQRVHPGGLRRSSSDASQLLDAEIIRLAPKPFYNHICDMNTAKKLQTFLFRMLSEGLRRPWADMDGRDRRRVRPLFFVLVQPGA